MKISTKSRYGIKAMLDLALHYKQGPTFVKDVAKRQKVSGRYLENLLTSLKVAGLVRSTRGTGGGFTLAKSPSQIRLSEIIQAMEGSLALVECVDTPEVCSDATLCVSRDVWVEMKRAMSGILESKTLQDLVEQQAEKEVVVK